MFSVPRSAIVILDRSRSRSRSNDRCVIAAESQRRSFMKIFCKWPKRCLNLRENLFREKICTKIFSIYISVSIFRFPFCKVLTRQFRLVLEKYWILHLNWNIKKNGLIPDVCEFLKTGCLFYFSFFVKSKSKNLSHVIFFNCF